MQAPTLRDVLEARQRIAPYIPRTPLYSYPALNKLLGAEIRLKHENHQALGSFKPRGGVNLLAQMTQEELGKGIVTASSGNHGQSIAYSAALFGAKAIICLPEGANPLKVESMRNLGAEIVFHGTEFDLAREHAARLAMEEGYRYVHPVNEPMLIAGVATQALEIIEDYPEVEVIMVPLGGGSGASGVCIVAKAINPEIKVVAVQSEQAPAGYLSWKNGHISEAPMRTAVEGLATASGYELPQSILIDKLDDFILVSDDEIRQAMTILLEKAHTMAEGAGAAGTAGALKMKDQLQGKKVAVVVSGGNVTLDQLREVVSRTLTSSS